MSEVYIRSQDKEGLYTIKESCGIRYKEFTNAGMKENRIMLNMDATSMYTLGIYESKERCIEIRAYAGGIYMRRATQAY